MQTSIRFNKVWQVFLYHNMYDRMTKNDRALLKVIHFQTTHRQIFRLISAQNSISQLSKNCLHNI